jgi:hypothetical protein
LRAASNKPRARPVRDVDLSVPIRTDTYDDTAAICSCAWAPVIAKFRRWCREAVGWLQHVTNDHSEFNLADVNYRMADEPTISLMSFQKMDNNAAERALRASLSDERITRLPPCSALLPTRSLSSPVNTDSTAVPTALLSARVHVIVGARISASLDPIPRAPNAPDDCGAVRRHRETRLPQAPAGSQLHKNRPEFLLASVR